VRIGLNALYLIPGGVGGTEVYARNLVRHLGEAFPGDEIVLFVAMEAADSFGTQPANVEVVRCPMRARVRPWRMAYEQTLLPLAVRRAGVEVLHSLGYTAPLVAGLPSVVTLHDLNYHFHPEDWGGLGLLANRLLIPRVARRATRVLTISHASEHAIRDVLGVPSDRIDVVYHGVDGNVLPIEPRASETALSQLGLEGPYLLTVTASHPHKNLAGLLAAYACYCAEASRPLPLVLVGLAGRDHQRVLDRAAARGRGRVLPTGWVDDVTLAALYRGARAFVFASRYEGFGFPILEAMSAGIPVVSSRATSLGEIAGDAALLVDPDDVAGMGVAMRRVLDEDDTRKDLIARGRARAATFTWRRTAELTRAVYERALAR
jgi:glycosyltransferase involved in cell wall biosynthesis